MPGRADAAEEVLAASLDLQTTVRTVARIGLPHLGEHCIVDLLAADGSLRPAGESSTQPEVENLLRSLRRPSLEAHPVSVAAEVVRTGRAIALQGAEARRAAATIVDRLAADEVLAVPLVGRGGPVGALTFVSSGAVSVAEQLAHAEALGRRAGLAIENARLFAASEEARRRAEAAKAEAALLFRLTDAAGRAESLADIFEPALDAVTEALGVERASILLFDEGKVMRFRAWRGLSEAYRLAVEGHSPWTAEARDPAPLVVPDVEEDASLAAHRPLFAAERIRALGFVPLCHRGELLGKFMIYSGVPRVFSDHDLRLARMIAGQIAQAVARQQTAAELARIHAEAEGARQAAETASRAREMLLAVVSHDLRNPLAVIVTSATLIAKVSPGGTPGELPRKYAQTIQRSARRMERLISDLLDAARLESGSLVLVREAFEADALLAAAVELFAPLAADNEQDLSIDLPSGRCPTAVGDRERLLQVLSNLVGNAVKFTPAGGHVTLGVAACEPDDRAVTFFVRDTGPGIPPLDLPHVFDRYWQAGRKAGRPTSSSSKEGVGLGLSIARGLVEAGGGRIWVESPSGAGATFYFTVPTANVNP